MNLTLHQLRHELRRSRASLLVYGFVLLGNLAISLRLVGTPSLRPDGSWEQGGVLNVIFILAYWIAFAATVADCVIADSPARRERFLATRPLPARALGGGKLLYLLVAVLLPAVAVEIISLAAAGAHPSAMLIGGLERLLLCSALGFATAAFAAHWKTIPAFLLAVGISFAAVMILGNFAESALRRVSDLRPVGPTTEPTYLTAIQGMLVIAVGLSVTAWICSRRGIKYRYLLPAWLPIAALGVFVMVISPFRTAKYRPADQPKIDALLTSKTATAKLVTRGYEISRRQDKSLLSASSSLTPVTTGFPDDLELRWQTRSHAWEVDGVMVEQRTRDSQALSPHHVSSDFVPVSWALASAIQGHLEAEVAFRLGMGINWNYSSSLSVPSLFYEPEGPLAGKQAQVRADIVGDAFSWEVAADLPFQAGQSARHDSSTWLIAGVRTGAGQDLRAQLSEETIALQTSGTINTRKDSSPWQNRNRFALYLPTRNEIWFADTPYAQLAPRVSASKQYLGKLEFSIPARSRKSTLTPEEIAGARLLILCSRFVGRITQAWKSPEFTLLQSPPSQGSHDSGVADHERWSSSEFALWFHRWEKVSPEADSATVHAHLQELVDRLEYLDNTITRIDEPVVIHVSRFVPRHLDVLLTNLSRATYHPTRVLVNAIALGAEPEQCQTILDHVRRVPSLEEVIRMRGWNEEARPTYLAMARTNPASARDHLSVLLAEEDPSLDQLLLDSYRVDPSFGLYESLRRVPRLASDTEQITRDLWNPGRLVLQRNRLGGTLGFGLLQGRPEALQELYNLIDLNQDHPDDAAWELSRLISNTIHLPRDVKGQDRDWKRIIRWAAEHRPSDFHFDPVLRRFALIAANQTI